MHILVSALGAQPDIITETVGVFNYAPTADFYVASRSLPQITAARQGLSRVDELWLVATDQPHQETSAADGHTRIINSTEENFACNRQLNEYDKKEPPVFLYVNNLPGPGTELFDLLVQEGIAVPSGADTLCLQSEAARFYLNGGWLEEYVFNLIKGLSINGLDCLLNVNFEWQIQRAASKKKKTENELDVVFSCNNRLHIISCKTSSLDILKNAGKDALHELDSMKANVGGLFARPLLVSVHPLKDADFRRAQNLKIPVVSGNNILHLQERLQQEWGIGR